ncbi:Pca regulon regulatory protein PcaR [Klebsiella michiganensis]|uniref:Pca regulon regulatory protein PcaR n=1 Tax=Klebsiella michiganensis TaxID=1134687 RepID=A0A7H4MY44_9ENTR|nr:Pca regulon regulatory protein PcaR [Klebsiella michiganensis]
MFTPKDGKNFQLRPKILALGHAWLASTPLARSAQPVLKHLSEMLNESCSIATLDGDDILYIARASSSRIMTIDLDIGSRLPAWATSMGRVLLSYQPEEKLNDMLGRVTMIRYTRKPLIRLQSCVPNLGACTSRATRLTIRSSRWGCARWRCRSLTLRGRFRRR